jgi:hypothetical protein
MPHEEARCIFGEEYPFGYRILCGQVEMTAVKPFPEKHSPSCILNARFRQVEGGQN